MKIVAYSTPDQDIPSGHRALARIMLNDGTWHPILIHAFDVESATKRATEWWAEALEKERVKGERGRKPRAPASQVTEKEPVPDPGDVV